MVNVTTVGEKSGVAVGSGSQEPEEVMAYCPHCKALQTIWLNKDSLMTTNKFFQLGNHIYHKCGAEKPCKLYYDRKP